MTWVIFTFETSSKRKGFTNAEAPKSSNPKIKNFRLTQFPDMERDFIASLCFRRLLKAQKERSFIYTYDRGILLRKFRKMPEKNVKI